MQEAPLPPVYEALLDAAGLDALFEDLTLLGGSLEVSVKHGPTRYGQGAPCLTLSEARAALARGEVRAVQLRYVHDGKLWCDTLLALPTGTRIVRMERVRPG